MFARKWFLVAAAVLSLAVLPAATEAKAHKNLAAKKTPTVQVSKKTTKLTSKKKSHHKKKHTASKHAKHKNA